MEKGRPQKKLYVNGRPIKRGREGGKWPTIKEKRTFDILTKKYGYLSPKLLGRKNIVKICYGLFKDFSKGHSGPLRMLFFITASLGNLETGHEFWRKNCFVLF